jgi:hypothetical protein
VREPPVWNKSLCNSYCEVLGCSLNKLNLSISYATLIPRRMEVQTNTTTMYAGIPIPKILDDMFF